MPTRRCPASSTPSGRTPTSRTTTRTSASRWRFWDGRPTRYAKGSKRWRCGETTGSRDRGSGSCSPTSISSSANRSRRSSSSTACSGCRITCRRAGSAPTLRSSRCGAIRSSSGCWPWRIRWQSSWRHQVGKAARAGAPRSARIARAIRLLLLPRRGAIAPLGRDEDLQDGLLAPDILGPLGHVLLGLCPAEDVAARGGVELRAGMPLDLGLEHGHPGLDRIAVGGTGGELRILLQVLERGERLVLGLVEPGEIVVDRR